MVLLKNLSARREYVGLNQQELADTLHVARTTIANWESGFSNPTAAMLPLLADTLLCSIDHLYGREEASKCQ